MESTQALLNLLTCRRRSKPCTDTSSVYENGITKFVLAASDSETTDASTAECSDFSDPASSPSSQDDSDNEVASCAFQAPPGFMLVPLPPGLDAPPGLAVEQKLQAPSRTSLKTRLSSQAALFVPGSVAAQSQHSGPAGVPHLHHGSEKPTRQTISLAQGVLQEWQAIADADKSHLQESPSVDKSTVHALQDAITRLSHNDAAALRSFLHTKEISPIMPVGNGLSMQAPQSISPHMGINADVVGACSPQFQKASYVSLAAGLPYPAAFGPAGVQASSPPGAFCLNQAATRVPAPWERPAVNANPSQLYAPCASKTQSAMTAPSGAVPEDSSRAMADDAKATLRTNLRDLSLADPAHVLMVRKINRLGLDSPGVLEAYFSRYGTVERVLVSHSRARSMFGRGAARVRPAGLGFLIMADVEGVEAALAAGLEHEIQGSSITVSRFESRTMDIAEMEATASQTQ